ncbi:MAG: hypothetical protein DLM64_06035 [Solirubrobacterales bacterium]|nr:MAG: hypothetical protein DLM64_06035 [Solirubrobacterales bacterium]
MKRAHVLQARSDCIVAIERGGDVVTKTFRGDDEDLQWSLACQEHYRLRAFALALRTLDGATCPDALDLVREPIPQLRMARAVGLPLPKLLGACRLDPKLRQRLAGTAAQALEVYVKRLGEPYYDFHFDNMLYDEASRTLTFVDLGVPPHYRMPVNRSAIGVSLGNLIGSTIFHSARPREFFRHRQQRQAVELCAAVVSRVLQSHPQVSAELPACARAAYERPARLGWHRHLWYATIGRLVARRIVVGQQAFSVRAWRFARRQEECS